MRPTLSYICATLLACGLACTCVSACTDTFHLDPAGTGGSASASTGSGAGGCHSNPDCAFPKPVCDTARHACVGCLTVSDCAYAPGTVCSKGVCECPKGAACGAKGTGGAGAGGGGAGGGETGGDAGGDGSDGAPACAATCNAAISGGGLPCAGTPGESVYQSLQNCAGCSGALGACGGDCSASLCMGETLDPLCQSCLTLNCMVLLSNCMAN